MGNSYMKANIKSTTNITNISNILTQNQNVVESTVISSQTQYITVTGTIDCTDFNVLNNDAITVTITGQMNAQTTNSISNYIKDSINNSLTQDAKITTGLLAVNTGDSEAIVNVTSKVSQFCATYITTQNMQTVMSSVRASQTQHIVLNNIEGSLCNFENSMTVAIAAQGILTAVTNAFEQNSLTSQIATSVKQYYTSDAKGLNSLVSSMLTTMLLPIIIVASVIAIIIVLVVVFKLISSMNHKKVVQQATALGIPVTPKAGIPAITTPKVGIPAITPPKIGIPAITPPKIGIPAITPPTIPASITPYA